LSPLTSAWCTMRSIIATTTSSPNTSPHSADWLVDSDDEAGPFVAGGDSLEEQVGGFGLERNVTHFVDDQQGVRVCCTDR
jgi:hypothetical protein